MEEKIIKIMQLVQIKKDNTVEFSEEAKKLIHEVAEKCRKLPVYKDNIDKADIYKADITAGEIYLDMCLKIVMQANRKRVLRRCVMCQKRM